MSKLQVALIALGVIIVTAIYGFNRWQERRYRKRAESAFKQRHDDVLLNDAAPPPRTSAQVRDRIEPQFQANDETPAAKVEVAERVEPRQINNAAPASPPPGAEKLDYQVDIVAQAPIHHSSLEKALKQVNDLVGRVHLWGASDSGWVTVDLHSAPRFSRVRATLQLVSRSGVMHQDDLLTFRRAMERCASDVEAKLEAADVEPYVEIAKDLDKFCQQSDVVVGLSVVAQKGGPFAGTKVRAWAEAAGFQLRPDGVFYYSDEHGKALINMESHENPGFLPERIRTLTTNGITLLLDVPRASNGLHSFDKLVSLARNLASTMGGALVDDNRMTVTEAGLDQIRAQLKHIYQDMDARGIPAGSPMALRLFS